jgi:PAS domain S-box-containing protein
LSAVPNPELLLGSLFAFAPVALQVFDASGHFVVANDALEELFGSTPPPDYNIFLDNVAESHGVTGLIRQAFAGEVITLPPAWYDPRDVTHAKVLRGKRVAVELTLFPLFDAAGAVPYVGFSYKDVTAEMKLREAKEALERSESSMRALLRSIGDGVLATDTAGRVIRMNPVASTLLCLSEDEALGRPIEEVFRIAADDTREPRANPVRTALTTGAAGAIAPHTVLITHDGQERAIADSASPIRDGDGAIQGAVLVFRDVTAERKSERERESLHRSRAAALSRLSMVIERMPIASLVLDGAFRVSHANLEAQRLLAGSHGQLVGMAPSWAFGELPEAGLAEAVLAHFQSGDIHHRRAASEALDGAPFCADWYTALLRDEHGAVSGAICMGVDRTARERAEAELRWSDERYRSLVEATSALVWTCDPQGRLREPTDAFRSYTGQSAEDMRTQGWEAKVHPVDRPRLQAAFRGADEPRAAFELDGRLFHAASNSYRYVVFRGVPLRDEAGTTRAWMGTITDIDERRKNHDELVRLEVLSRELQEASRLKSEFLANMSHELRTPLNAILGFTELIQDGLVQPGTRDFHDFLGHVASSGRHLLGIINDVLDLAKVEAGKLSFKPESISLRAIVEDVVAVLRNNGRSGDVALEVAIDPAMDRVTLDPARLRQVLFNYLSNALKFAPAGSSVTVRAFHLPGERFRLEVTDLGPGLSVDDQTRLFIEFSQIASCRAASEPGTGLGLALTRKLVEAQDGVVGVESSLGQGSTFFAELPLSRESSAPSQGRNVQRAS